MLLCYNEYRKIERRFYMEKLNLGTFLSKYCRDTHIDEIGSCECDELDNSLFIKCEVKKNDII